MYTIQGYVKVKSLEEAYELNQKKSSAVIGGGMWLRLGSRAIGTAIDLSDLELNRIEETEDEFIIGCMTSLRDIECHEGLNRYFHGMMKNMLKGDRWHSISQYGNHRRKSVSADLVFQIL